METIFILILVVLVFSITIGVVLINRDDIPDVLIEEKRLELEERKEEIDNRIVNNKFLEEMSSDEDIEII